MASSILSISKDLNSSSVLHIDTMQLPSRQILDSTHYTVLSIIFAVVTVCFPRHSALRKGFLFLQIALVAQAFISTPPTDVANTAVTYTFGILLSNFTARYLDRLYLHAPEKEFHRIKEDRSKEDAEKLPSLAKLFWAFELFTVTRGVGWDWQVSGIPKSKPQTRSQFLAIRLLKLVAMYAGLYIVGLTCQNIRNEFVGIPYLQLREVLVSLTMHPLFLYLFIVAAYGITIYSHFGMWTLPLSLLCVGLRIGPPAWQEPKNWPPNFGSIRQAYSLRRFWGYTWHQQLRRVISTPAAKLTSLAPSAFIKPKTRLARLGKRYFFVLAAFFTSGCIHAGGSYAVTRARDLPLSDGGEIKYFLLQGMALIVEDFTCWILGIDDQASTQPTALRRWIGYTITGTWYIWSRVALKAIPLALAHGIRDERGPLFAALILVERGALAVPGNFIAFAFGGYPLA